MKSDASLPLIDVGLLRVGMFVQLDIGWMEHPFALSRFRIAHQDQIDTLIGLGLKQVRWNPELSELGRPSESAAAMRAKGTPANDARVQDAPKVDHALMEEIRLRQALAQEQAALQACEQRFSELGQAHQAILALAMEQPELAGAQALSLAQSLSSQLVGPQDISIRLLTEAAGQSCHAHATNVAVLAMLMGRVFGWNSSDLAELCVGALFHDIGKLALAPDVRLRNEAFNSAQMSAYRDHVAQGVVLGRRMKLPDASLLVIGQHHEFADGSGFPMGHHAERLSAAARVVSLLNHYDNLCNRPHGEQTRTPHEAVSLLFTQGTDKFDTSILAAFIKMMGVYPPGSLVQLTDDRYAMVVAVNSSRPMRPKVRVYDPRLGWKADLLLDLEQGQGLGIRRSLKAQQVPSAAREFLSPRSRAAYFFEALPMPVAA